MADLIEREKVLEILRIIGHGRPISGKRAISLISEMPSSSMWIPCSERLPSDFSYVLCSGRDGMGILRYIGAKWLDENALAYSVNEITHWMPLPEPPEVTQDE